MCPKNVNILFRPYPDTHPVSGYFTSKAFTKCEDSSTKTDKTIFLTIYIDMNTSAVLKG